MSIKKLVSQTATYGITTIIVRFINYFLTPYFTNLAIFTPEVYGVMSYYYAIIPFGLSLLTLGLETGYFRFSGKCESAEQQNRLFNTLTSTVAVLSLLFFVAVFAFSGQIHHFLEGDKAGDIAIIPIVAAIIAIDAFSSMPYARLREIGDTKTFMKAKVMNVVVNLLLCLFFYSLLPILSERGVLSFLWNEGFGSGYVFVAALISSIVTLSYLKGVMQNFRFEIDKKVLKTVLLFSIPLFVSGFTGTANQFIDRQLLYFLLPGSTATAQIGLYSAAMKIAAFMYLFIQMYKYAAEPYFLSEVKESEFEVRNAQALKYFTVASLAIFLFISLFIDYFQYFVGAEFREGIKVVSILLWANIFMGIYLNLSYWYKVSEKTLFAIVISLVGVVITVVLNLILIPKIGYSGSAWARVACEGTMTVISYVLGQKYMPINYNLKSIFSYIALTLLLYGGFLLLDLDGLFARTSVAMLFFIIFALYFVYQEGLFSRLKNIVKKK